MGCALWFLVLRAPAPAHKELQSEYCNFQHAKINQCSGTEMVSELKLNTSMLPKLSLGFLSGPGLSLLYREFPSMVIPSSAPLFTAWRSHTWERFTKMLVKFLNNFFSEELIY